MQSASRTGLMGSTGSSQMLQGGTSIGVGLLRPPRWTRYFSSQWASIRHSKAQRSNSLPRIYQQTQKFYARGGEEGGRTGQSQEDTRLPATHPWKVCGRPSTRRVPGGCDRGLTKSFPSASPRPVWRILGRYFFDFVREPRRLDAIVNVHRRGLADQGLRVLDRHFG